MEPLEQDKSRDIRHEIEEECKLARDYLLYYDERLRAYEAQKAEYLAPRKTGGARGSSIGNPTAQQAIKAAIYDEEHEEYYWLRAVRVLEGGLSTRMSIFLKARREGIRRAGKIRSRGRIGWAAYTACRYAELTAESGREQMPPTYQAMHTWEVELVKNVVLIFGKIKNKN